MEKRIQTIAYKNHNILYVDFSELKKSEEIIAVIVEAEKIIAGMLGNILFLINIKNAVGSPSVIEHYMPFAKRIKPKISKDAVVGMSGLQTILVNGIKKFAGVSMESFATKEEALEYLIK